MVPSCGRLQGHGRCPWARTRTSSHCSPHPPPPHSNWSQCHYRHRTQPSCVTLMHVRWSPRTTVALSLSHSTTSRIPAYPSYLTDHYVRPDIKADSGKWTRTCLKCQKSKVQRHTVTPLSTFAHDLTMSTLTLWDLCHPLKASDMHRPLHPLARSSPHGQHHS